ncbi:hypothetical protein [Paracoccus pacificus]|uniref:Uncharacterized protein n=1 Tax=Paracoccus pacificus TaxID=1463598 RepID=A0ABW4R4U8_9RHOB
MRFDPYSWHEVSVNEEYEAAKGRLRVRCSAQAPLYISAQGCEALAGVETSFDVEVSEAVTWRVDAPEGVRVFVHAPPGTVLPSIGEVFTNIDRLPEESGSMYEVQKALRALEMERRAYGRDMRAAIAAVRRQGSVKTPAPSAVAPVEPEPDADEAEE